MYSLPLLATTLLLAGTESGWLTDYEKATTVAVKEKKDLVIYFRGAGELDDALKNADVKEALKKFVCLRVPLDYEYQGKKLLEHEALLEMIGKPGLAVISYHNAKLPTFGQAISVHPMVSSRYRWVPAYGPAQIKITLELPAHATLSQRSMIYAVRVHPEVPQSVFSVCHPAFLEHAQRHSKQQANVQRQHHANLGSVMGWLQGRVDTGLGGASEVVAESWGRFVGGENVLEASFSCIDAWRHSPGHWGAVARRHTYFGYDIAKGANGTWYACGIFAR